MPAPPTPSLYSRTSLYSEGYIILGASGVLTTYALCIIGRTYAPPVGWAVGAEGIEMGPPDLPLRPATYGPLTDSGAVIDPHVRFPDGDLRPTTRTSLRPTQRPDFSGISGYFTFRYQFCSTLVGRYSKIQYRDVKYLRNLAFNEVSPALGMPPSASRRILVRPSDLHMIPWHYPREDMGGSPS